MEKQRRGVQAVILDWAGTTVDYGCQAPTRVFQEIFARLGIPITDRQAREPMGRAKREHIAAILQMPPVQQRWQTKFGKPSDEADVDQLYHTFLPLQKTVLAQHSEVVPGTVEFARLCRTEKVKIGSTTGYTRELMDIVMPLAADQGYAPDAVVCADDVAQGRPAPWMLFEAAKRMDVYPVRSLVVVDDTPVGIEAGQNAGCWTVAVVKSSNELGLTCSQVAELGTHELQPRLELVRARFQRTGAHFVIDSVANLWDVVSQIDRHIELGERP